MAQVVCAAMEHNSRLAMFHQNQGFPHAVQEEQRRARDAGNRAVLDSPDRCETALSTELRVAQRKNESTMEMRERESIFRIGNEVQAVRQQRAFMLMEHHQLVQEGDAQRYFNRH